MTYTRWGALTVSTRRTLQLPSFTGKAKRIQVSKLHESGFRIAACTPSWSPFPERRGVRWLSIGRMLDLGGMPAASNDSSLIRTVNASKNSKLQAVAFDFNLLTTSFDDNNKDAPVATPTKSSSVAIQPDLDKIQQVASLLNVSIETSPSTSSGNDITSPRVDDTKPPTKILPQTRAGEDIRAKYASKLKGGLAGIELAKSEVQDSLARGDAAGHLNARKLVKEAASPQLGNSTRWMATTGSGKLLSYLTHRSIKIALLPDTKWSGCSESHRPMYDLSKQLPEVIIDVVIDVSSSEKKNSSSTTTLTNMLKKQLLQQLDMDPHLILLVSDRDDYLRAARDLGMITCRLQPPNARRGNVSGHYIAQSIPRVQDVVDEINGISFNAVLNR